MGKSGRIESLKIETASRDDAAILLGLIEQYYTYDGIKFDREKIKPGLDELLANQNIGRAWIVRLHDEIIGYAIATFGFDLEFGGRRATLTDLYLVPGHRRNGLGSVLFRHIESECSKAGAHAMELMVEEDNEEARAFYLKMGYERLTRNPMNKYLVTSV